jgi:hypothetical protein
VKAASKTILYTITGAGATSKMTPIAIFADENKCRPYAVAVMTTYKRNDVEEIGKLGLKHLVTEDGTLAKGLRFHRVTLPYEPALQDNSEDPFAAEPAPAT